MARLIDADDFIEKLDLLGTHQYVLTKNQVKFLLMEQPIIDPVKHGEWIMRGGKLYCSECGEKACVTRDMEDFWYTKGTDFCPNCGARMDGE